ncbi:TetR/AcrR family acrAB operon transcriptional repressor [Paraburkholderia sp. JPY158]|uniref:TetR/AcrR family acrAB operon transcriptional repressor n=1 Tax=Paraburkholderia atlantica TaxID=2654982 RepID=A0A7W8V5H7_PARAM|nr:TetR family transcriptional regulator [Paraburkholderia atlantica]MBB5423595.1 TetR/AcrR family acrAB operon transcriptional repressor [Paraburkholderia atlantica]
MKRKLQGLATREKLLDSAECLFFAHGVASTTLEDIARASGMTRGAIYCHFANKWSLVSALFERSELPLDAFTVSGAEAATGTIDALRVELERRLVDVLRIGTKRRLYSIALSTAEIDADCTLSASMFRESALLAQYSIEATLARVAKPPGASDDLDCAFEATFIHACLTGYFRRSLIIPPPAGAEKLLAGKIVRKALSSWLIESPPLFPARGGLTSEAGIRR